MPGLAAAISAEDTDAMLEAVYRACLPTQAAARPAGVSRSKKATADDVLDHRFTFYGETYQLPADIDWDDNPGTAHWGHDLNRFSYLDDLTQTYLATGDAPTAGRRWN